MTNYNGKSTEEFWIGHNDNVKLKGEPISIRLEGFRGQLCRSHYREDLECLREGELLADMLITYVNPNTNETFATTVPIGSSHREKLNVSFPGIFQEYKVIGYNAGANKLKGSLHIKVTTTHSEVDSESSFPVQKHDPGILSKMMGRQSGRIGAHSDIPKHSKTVFDIDNGGKFDRGIHTTNKFNSIYNDNQRKEKNISKYTYKPKSTLIIDEPNDGPYDGPNEDESHIGGRFNKIFCNLSPAQKKLTSSMMALFSQHVDYTRQLMLVKFYNKGKGKNDLIPEVSATFTRLLRNQDEIGKTFGYYTIVTHGEKLAELLREHIIIFGKIVTLVFNEDDATKQINELQKNGNDISDFITTVFKLNPKRKIKIFNTTLTQAFQMHLTQTTRELLALSKSEFSESMKQYDITQHHMAKIARFLIEHLSENKEKFRKSGPEEVTQ